MPFSTCAWTVDPLLLDMRKGACPAHNFSGCENYDVSVASADSPTRFLGGRLSGKAAFCGVVTLVKRASNVYTTGTSKSVKNVEKSMPPTTARPNG